MTCYKRLNRDPVMGNQVFSLEPFRDVQKCKTMLLFSLNCFVLGYMVVSHKNMSFMLTCNEFTNVFKWINIYFNILLFLILNGKYQ